MMTPNDLKMFLENINSSDFTASEGLMEVAKMVQEAYETGNKIQLSAEETEVYIESMKQLYKRINAVNSIVLENGKENANDNLTTATGDMLEQNNVNCTVLYNLLLDTLEHEADKVGVIDPHLTDAFISEIFTKDEAYHTYCFALPLEKNLNSDSIDVNISSDINVYLRARLYNNKDLRKMLNTCYMNYIALKSNNEIPQDKLNNKFVACLRFFEVLFKNFIVQDRGRIVY